MALTRNQNIKHLRTDALVSADGLIYEPAAGVLLKGELAINVNSKDPTLFIGTVVNATTSDKGEVATTANAKFKSLGWFETNIFGTTNLASIRTLKYITDTLDLLAADSDNVINTWSEIKSFLSTVPSDAGFDIMSLFNGKANLSMSITTLNKNRIATTAITGNGTNGTATFATQASAPFAVNEGIVISGATPIGWNGTWVVTACTTTSVTFKCTFATTATIQGAIAGNTWYSDNTADTAKLYDNISITSDTIPASGNIPSHARLKVNVATILPNANTGAWIDDAWVAPAYTDNSNIASRAPKASEIRTFYNTFNQMFTFDGSTIRANYDFYSVAGNSALGQGTVGGVGGSGLIANVVGLAGFGGVYAADDNSTTFNAYAINKVGVDLTSALNRISSLENGSATSIVTAGTGNVITSITKSGTTITANLNSIAILEGDARLSNTRANPFALTFTGYSTSTYTGSAAVSVAIPNNTNQLTNGAGFLTAITKAQVEGVLTGAITSHTHSYLSGNQTVTLSGDVTGSGATAITTAISAATVTGKALTGYTLATAEAALTTTDTILAALGKLEKAINNRPVVGNVGITTVGTIATGTWNASTIAVNRGGTGMTSYSVGSILYASAAATLAALPAAAVDNVLLSNGTGAAPVYGKVGLTTHISGILGVANGGTGLNAIAANGMYYASVANTLSVVTTSAFGRSLLNAVSGTTFAGLAAATADTLKNGRNIKVVASGVTCTGTSFNGSADISIAMTIDTIDCGTF